MPKKSKTPDGAKARLKNMTTAEVSLVDHGANMADFIVRKSKDQLMPAKKKNETAPEGANAAEDTAKEDGATATGAPIPAEARAELIDGVMDVLEKIAGVTAYLKESVVDDSAEVPGEPIQALKDAGAALTKLAGKYGATDEQPPTEKPSGEEAAPTDEETEKARRFTQNRISALRAIVDQGAKLLAEVDSPPADTAGEGEAAPAATDETTKVLSQLADAVKMLGGKIEAFEKNSRDGVAKANKKAEENAEALAELKKNLSSPGESRSQGAEGQQPTQKSDPNSYTWPDDMSAAVMNG